MAPPGLPAGSPGYKFLARYKAELRPAVLECVTLYGINALLNAYAMEELTFDQLTAVTENACRASSAILNRGRVEKPEPKVVPRRRAADAKAKAKAKGATLRVRTGSAGSNPLNLVNDSVPAPADDDDDDDSDYEDEEEEEEEDTHA